jgi:hypothetical protein
MPATDPALLSHKTAGPGMWEIVQQRSAWGTWICLFCGNYYLYFMVTWLPFYLERERHFSTIEMAKVGGGFFLVAALSASVCGWLSDHWIRSGETPTFVRKAFMVCGCRDFYAGLRGGLAQLVHRVPDAVWAVVRAEHFQFLGDHPEAGRAAGGRAVVRTAIVRGEFVGSRGRGGHRIPARPHGALLLAVSDRFFVFMDRSPGVDIYRGSD